jgi:hypothetical protein
VPRPVDPFLSSPVPAANAAFCKSNVPILPNHKDHLADLHQIEPETLGDTPDYHYPGGSDYHDYMDLPEDDHPPSVRDAETGTCPRRAFFVFIANNSDGSFFRIYHFSYSRGSFSLAALSGFSSRFQLFRNFFFLS